MNIIQKWINGDYYILTLALIALLGGICLISVIIIEALKDME